MILLADSGSTKTSWRFIQKSGAPLEIETGGINPFFRSSQDIVVEIKELLLTISDSVNEIFYYGAGVVNSEKAKVIENALHEIYPESEIYVNNDLLGAAKSVCGDQSGVVCILGTGSNCCYYDGNKITEKIPPLGFILGDEGSGAVMGKNLVSDYFKKVMPEEVRLLFEKEYEIDQSDILEKVYKKEKPNMFLASFTKFLYKYIDNSYCNDFVINQFKVFIERNILQLHQDRLNTSINFVGSIASVFENQVTEALDSYNLIKGKIVKSPINGLIEYHKNK